MRAMIIFNLLNNKAMADILMIANVLLNKGLISTTTTNNK